MMTLQELKDARAPITLLIIGVLTERPRKMFRAAEVAERIEQPRYVVSTALNQLWWQGRIARPHYGYYQERQGYEHSTLQQQQPLPK